jgi:predicted metal-dependent phosphoesterase TrpH
MASAPTPPTGEAEAGEPRPEAEAGESDALALPLSRADLHVHTNASIFKYFRAANSRDSYNEPEEVYRLCKARGMDFVTFTDHDTVDGCLRFQDRHPELQDFFVSAEIETFFPKTGHRIHVNVFDLTARQHAVIHRKRRNIFDLVDYLKAEDLLFSANHMFQSYRFRQAPEVFVDTMLRLFDVFEVKNGTMAYQHNALVEDLLGAVKRKRGSVALIGGSDAHTYPPVASVFTLAPGPTWKEFLGSIRQGRAVAWGTEQGFTRVLLDVYGLLGKFYRSVTDFKNPDYTAAQKARHFILAAAALPINVAGIPAAIWSLNYAKQVALSNTFKSRFARMGLAEPEDSDGADT